MKRIEGLSTLQGKVREWQRSNFGSVPTWELILGVCEESGELAHCIVKRRRAMYTQEQMNSKMRDAIGDIVVFLMGVCEEEGWDLGEIICETVASVSSRNWT